MTPTDWLAEWGAYMVANEACRREHERPATVGRPVNIPRRFRVAQVQLIYRAAFGAAHVKPLQIGDNRGSQLKTGRGEMLEASRRIPALTPRTTERLS
jgi:hypothetical protein